MSNFKIKNNKSLRFHDLQFLPFIHPEDLVENDNETSENNEEDSDEDLIPFPMDNEECNEECNKECNEKCNEKCNEDCNKECNEKYNDDKKVRAVVQKVNNCLLPESLK